MPSRKSPRKHLSRDTRPVSPRREAAPRTSAGRTTVQSWVLRSPAKTLQFGRDVARELKGGEVLALRGDLGAGKTQFVRGLAAGLGAPPRAVSSPTFVFIHEYRGRLPLAHIDLYRIESTQDLDHLGWGDYLDGQWVVAVEWAEKAGGELPADRMEILLAHRTPTTRTVTCSAVGPTATALLTRLQYLSRPRASATHSRRRSTKTRTTRVANAVARKQAP